MVTESAWTEWVEATVDTEPNFEPSEWTAWVEATVDADPSASPPFFVGPNGGLMRTQGGGLLRPKT